MCGRVDVIQPPHLSILIIPCFSSLSIEVRHEGPVFGYFFSRLQDQIGLSEINVLIGPAGICEPVRAHGTSSYGALMALA